MDLSRPGGMMRECTAGDRKEDQKDCDYFEANKDGCCINLRFEEFCPYWETFKPKGA